MSLNDCKDVSLEILKNVVLDADRDMSPENHKKRSPDDYIHMFLSCFSNTSPGDHGNRSLGCCRDTSSDGHGDTSPEVSGTSRSQRKSELGDKSLRTFGDMSPRSLPLGLFSPGWRGGGSQGTPSALRSARISASGCPRLLRNSATVDAPFGALTPKPLSPGRGAEFGSKCDEMGVRVPGPERRRKAAKTCRNVWSARSAPRGGGWCVGARWPPGRHQQALVARVRGDEQARGRAKGRLGARRPTRSR